jgi:hypothetical protein
MLEGFSVRQDPWYRRTAPRSAVGTSSGFDSPAALPAERPRLGAPGWAGEKVAFLSILRSYPPNAFRLHPAKPAVPFL